MLFGSKNQHCELKTFYSPNVVLSPLNENRSIEVIDYY